MFTTFKNFKAYVQAIQSNQEKCAKFSAVWEYCAHKEFPTADQVERLIKIESAKYANLGFSINLIRKSSDVFQQCKKRWGKNTSEVVAKKFGLIGKLTGFSAMLMDATLPAMENGLAGETLVYEVNGVDAVNFYIDLFVEKWNYLAEHEEDTWQDCVRAIVRHEFRHVKQFLELRKRGNGYVLLAFSKDIEEIDYLNKLLERDAFRNQWMSDDEQDNIKAVIDNLVATKFHAA